MGDHKAINQKSPQHVDIYVNIYFSTLFSHYSVPRVPSIKDIEAFKGIKVHSHDYRDPSLYKDKTVVVLGAAASGLDICLEVSTVAKKVRLLHRPTVASFFFFMNGNTEWAQCHSRVCIA